MVCPLVEREKEKLEEVVLHNYNVKEPFWGVVKCFGGVGSWEIGL